MSVITIFHYHSEPGNRSSDSTIENAFQALSKQIISQNLTIGINVPDAATVQVTAEQGETIESHAILASLRPSFGAPTSTFNVSLRNGNLTPHLLATAPIVEYVQVWFPISQANPEFQRNIEQDFQRFDDIFIEGARNTTGWMSGWIEEEQEHEAIVNEKARCFFVARGWVSMSDFQNATQQDAYKRAAPVLFAWNAPFKMVSYIPDGRVLLKADRNVVACRARSWVVKTNLLPTNSLCR